MDSSDTRTRIHLEVPVEYAHMRLTGFFSHHINNYTNNDHHG